MSIFLTADQHLGHFKILEYSKRPFATVEEMDEHIISAWNDRISHKDDIYCLGDMSFHRLDKTVDILSRLKGRIHLILGNHDAKRLAKYKLDRFVWVKDYYELKVPSEMLESGKVVLSHYAFETWNKSHFGSIHCHGHSHGTLAPRGRRMDVGVDTRSDYAPWSLEEVIETVSKREIHWPYHHVPRQ